MHSHYLINLSYAQVCPWISQMCLMDASGGRSKPKYKSISPSDLLINGYQSGKKVFNSRYQSGKNEFITGAVSIKLCKRNKYNDFYSDK